jgi:arylsulfatase A-like enzyme
MPSSDRPNVVLAVLDTARADHFGPFGGLASTPAFDALAARGNAVRAVATSPWTVPSHASMFSGLLPFEHGVTGAAAITEERRLASLAPAIERLADRWLPEALRRSGYRTVAVSANVWITPPMGFDLGFEEFVPVGTARVAPRGGARRRRLEDLVPDMVRRRAKRAVRYGRDARLGRDFGARAALREVRRVAAESDPAPRPLFLFVNVMEAHAPYLPPPPFNPLTGAERLRAPAINHRYLGDEFVAAFNLGAAEAPEEALGILRRLYAAEVSYVDRFLAGLVDAFEPMLDRTLLVVTADHGENLGEDHRLGHALALDERLLFVPLAVSGPGAPDLRGRPVTSLASLPGLICGAVSIGDHPWAARSGDASDGFVAVAQYESGWNHLRRAAGVARRYRLSAEQQLAMRAIHRAATDGRTLLVQGPAGERATGAEAGAETLERLRAALREAPEGPVEAGVYSPAEEAEIEERLRELGYL